MSSPFIYGPNGAQNLVPNALANNFIDAYTTTATAAGTTTLTVGSTAQQYFTGTTTQTALLPVTSTLIQGLSFIVTNNSTGSVTVQSSGANTVMVQAANTTAIYTCILLTGTTAASWNVSVLGSGGAVRPTVSTALNTGTATGTGGFVSGTYTTPANVVFIQVEMAGGGGGGAGSGTTGTTGAGGGGGNTTFGPSLLVANGGAGGAAAPTITYAAGGTASLGSAIGLSLTGGSGGGGGFIGSSAYTWAGSGGSNPFGGAGGSAGATQNGDNGKANTGGGASGGGSGGAVSNVYGGGGGGAGGYAKAIIYPTAGQTFSYSVGAGGTAGTNGTGGGLGGAGGTGVIIVTEYYANGAIGTATTVTGPVPSSQVLGTTVVGNAPAGFIGELIANNAGSTIPVGTSGALINLTSVSLTAGDWDVDGTVEFTAGASTSGTLIAGAISLTSGGSDTVINGGYFQNILTIAVSQNYLYPTGRRRINVSTTTTVYLVGAASYTAAGGANWGTSSFIQARRVR